MILVAQSARARAASWLSALLVSLAGCPASVRAPDAAPQSKGSEAPEVAEQIYDGGLRKGWRESGSGLRDPSSGVPAKVRFNDSGDWVLTRPGLSGHFGGVLFRVKEPPGEGEFLELRVGSEDGHSFPAVKLKPDHCTDAGDGWKQVLVPMAELNPDEAPFDRVDFRSFRPFGGDWVLFDKIGLAKMGVTGSSAVVGRPARARLACDRQATKISPLIYGVSAGEDWAKLGATARRWGGNPTSRYNWETQFSNAAQDWFFENRPGGSYSEFLADDAAHGAQTALTIPMLGWVAKDGTSFSFPVSVYGPQSKTDPWRPDAGSGVNTAGVNITPGSPTGTSVPAPPDWVKRWVTTLRAGDAKTGKRSVYEYILDNEPMLWNTTHRDVRPEPLGYDELLDRTIQYGSAIREADPEALIAGPAEWGWTGYFYSAKDNAGVLHPDRRAHEDLPLVEWYLRKLREHEDKTRTRILDVLDLHYYPQASNVYGGGAGGSDRSTQLLRLRSTRSLWDPTYVDESWIKDRVRLLPRMKEWVDKNYPGRGISIGEWNFGGEKDATGALATAEALGRFAQFASRPLSIGRLLPRLHRRVSGSSLTVTSTVGAGTFSIGTSRRPHPTGCPCSPRAMQRGNTSWSWRSTCCLIRPCSPSSISAAAGRSHQGRRTSTRLEPPASRRPRPGRTPPVHSSNSWRPGRSPSWTSGSARSRARERSPVANHVATQRVPKNRLIAAVAYGGQACMAPSGVHQTSGAFPVKMTHGFGASQGRGFVAEFTETKNCSAA